MSSDKLTSDTIKEVKATLVSVKGSLTVSQLRSDYETLLGKKFPLRELRCSSLENFLQKFPKEFYLANKNGILHVNATPDASTSHVAKFVHEQKPSVRKKVKKPVRYTKYNSYPKQVEPFSYYKKAVRYSAPSRFSTSSSGYSAPLRYSASSGYSAPSRYNASSGYSAPSRYNASSGYNAPSSGYSAYSSGNSAYSSGYDLISSGHEANSRYKSIILGFSGLSPKHSASSSGYNSPSSGFTSPLSSSKRSPLLTTPSIISVPQQAKKPTNISITVLNDRASSPTSDWKTVLKRKCDELNLEHNLKVIPAGQKKKNWISIVKVNEKSFSSYPTETVSPANAEEVAIKKALQYLDTLKVESDLLVTSNFSVIASRIKKILEDNCEGFWWDHAVKSLYEENYKETLPSEWCENLFKNPGPDIEIVCPYKGEYVLQLKKFQAVNNLSNALSEASISSDNSDYLNDESSGEYLNELSEEHQNDESNANNGHPPPLLLPSSQFWNVIITCVKESGEVCFRLIDDDYYEPFENLVTDIEIYYADVENRIPVKMLGVGNYCLYINDNLCSRVKVLDIDDDNVNILFVDDGEDETVELATLFEISSEFLNIPCQSICATLNGLDSVGLDFLYMSDFMTEIIGKSLVAEVLHRERPISVILFDTSGITDINLNKKLIESMVTYTEPVLPEAGHIAEVFVVSVTDDGLIYVCIDSRTLKELKDMLLSAKAHAAAIFGDTNMAVDPTRLYLVKFNQDGQFHRAFPNMKHSDILNQKVEMKCIDTGMVEVVSINEIVKCCMFSKKLSNVPGQAVECTLHNVPSFSGYKWCQTTSDRLRSLLPVEEPLLLKVVEEKSSNTPAKVELYKRIQPNNELVSLNATLSLEQSLFKVDDKNNNLIKKDMGTRYSSPSSPTYSGLISKRSSSSNESGSFRSISPPVYSPVLDYASPKLESPKVPEIGTFFDVFVTYAATPSNFAVISRSQLHSLQSLMNEMQDFYKNEKTVADVCSIHEGNYYVVKHADSAFYRAKVTKNMGQLICGVFIDYGDSFHCSPNAVRSLHSKFRNLSCQAMKATLAAVTPLNKDWMPEDTTRFRELVEEKDFVSEVIGIKKDSECDFLDHASVTLVLNLVDTKDPQTDVYISDILVKESRAIKS